MTYIHIAAISWLLLGVIWYSEFRENIDITNMLDILLFTLSTFVMCCVWPMSVPLSLLAYLVTRVARHCSKRKQQAFIEEK